MVGPTPGSVPNVAHRTLQKRKQEEDAHHHHHGCSRAHAIAWMTQALSTAPQRDLHARYLLCAHARTAPRGRYIHLSFWQVAFTIGAAILLVLILTFPADRRGPLVGTFLVCSTASAAYLAKCTGIGEIQAYGQKIPMARHRACEIG